MKYFEIRPAPEHERHVECFWQFQSDDTLEEAPAHIIVPDGAVSISYISFPNRQTFIGLTGPSTKAHKTTLVPGAIYAGIRIRPGAAGSVLGENIFTYRDKFGPQIRDQPNIVKLLQARIPNDLRETTLAPLLGSAADLLIETGGPLDDPVCQFTDAIKQSCGNTNLGELSNFLGVSQRQLRRRFKYQCGLTPKEFSRLRRVREVCIELLSRKNLPLANMAAQSGYADQAHMSREFQDVFENSTTLVAEYLKQISHGTLVENFP